jgi:hypothetical protein
MRRAANQNLDFGRGIIHCLPSPTHLSRRLCLLLEFYLHSHSNPDLPWTTMPAQIEGVANVSTHIKQRQVAKEGWEFSTPA